VTAARTPTLWSLAAAGGRAPEGGRAPLPSTTYPGFASLLTGASPEVHGIRTTFHRAGAVPGWAGETEVAVPTLLDACRSSGIGAAAVLGDQKLYAVLRAGDPGAPWPAGGRLPANAPRDAHGYLANDAAWPAMVGAIRDPANALVFCHLNEADTVGHDAGPDSEEALACYAATDRIVARLVDVVRASWERWLVIVVSDHDMEPRGPEHGIDPMTLPGISDLATDWMGDGGSCWLRLRPGMDSGRIDRVVHAIPEASGWQLVDDRLLLLARAGIAWHAGPIPVLGIHGGPTARRTVAIVGGGHPVVPRLAHAIADRPPELRDWAPTIAALLGVPLAHADGRILADLSSGEPRARGRMAKPVVRR
jgi:hypothetical protein